MKKTISILVMLPLFLIAFPKNSYSEDSSLAGMAIVGGAAVGAYFFIDWISGNSKKDDEVKKAEEYNKSRANEIELIKAEQAEILRQEQEKKQKEIEEQLEQEKTAEYKRKEERKNKAVFKTFTAESFFEELKKNKYNFGKNYKDKKIKINAFILTDINKNYDGDISLIVRDKNFNIAHIQDIKTPVERLAVGEHISIEGFYIQDLYELTGFVVIADSQIIK